MLKSKRKNDADITQVTEESRRRASVALWTRIYSAPYWLLAFALLWIYVVVAITNNADYQEAWKYIRGDYFQWMTESVGCAFGSCPSTYSTTPPDIDGIILTLSFAFISYTVAVLVGLFIGIVRANPPMPPNSKPNLGTSIRKILYLMFYNVLTFYVEFMRGIPSLVFVLVAAFVLLPALRDSINDGIVLTLNNLGIAVPQFRVRGIDPITGILSLSLIYAAYLSEVFRAGIQSIGRGQIEAARSLGMTWLQTMRHIVIPQAIRAVLPPLGNDFIAIIKDTALLTILGINDVTQLTRKWVGTSFKYPESYLVLSTIYLTMTISGSLLVQWMERRLRRHER